MMNTTLISTISVASAITTTNETINDNGEINKENVNGVLLTTISTSATIAANAAITHQHEKKMVEKYRESYVASMSDEELLDTLIKLDELNSEEYNLNDIKTV